jgi:hypothetical protein
LGRAQEEFHTLAVRLWELAPDHAIFEETAFTNEAMDELVSFGSWKSQKMHGLYKETRNNSICLRVCINKIEQSAPVAAQNPCVPLPNSGSAPPPLSPHSADEPDGWGEWGGAGIIMNLNPSVSGVDRGHDQGAATPPPNNGAGRPERVSTGGGPPGARVRRQHGQE